MLYAYRDDSDDLWEFDFPMGTAPDEFWSEDDGMRYRRVYTAPGIVLKGSGWGSKS